LNDLTLVGTHPKGNGRFGHSDLAGNSLTWTRDYAVTYPLPCTDCAASDTGGWRLIRGGGWSYDASYMIAGFRFALYPTYIRTADLGIRCARVP